MQSQLINISNGNHKTQIFTLFTYCNDTLEPKGSKQDLSQLIL